MGRIATLFLMQLSLVFPFTSKASEAEFRLKSAYVLQFVQYVDWPEEALPAHGPVKIVHFGGPEMLAELKELAGKKRVHGHAIEVTTEPDPSAHIVLADPENPRWLKYDQTFVNKPALLINVGEKDDKGPFVIQFFIGAGRLRFEISQKAAKNQKLRLSSQLLKLAVITD